MSTARTALARLGPFGGVMALVGGILFAVGFFGATTPEAKRTVMQSYVFAYIFWSTLTLGCLGLTLLHHTIRARWSLSILRLLEAGGGPLSILMMAILFIPIGLNVAAQDASTVYLWARPEGHENHIIHAKAFFLNVPGFMIRQGVYFLGWFALAAFLRSSSLKQDQTLNSDESAKRTNVSAPGMVFFVVLLTGAVTDWVMSLEPLWFSTMLPLLFVAGSALSALSLMIVLMMRHASSDPYREVVRPGLTKDLGNMLFALTLLWTYLTLSQFLITWSGNLPEEIPYYVARSAPTGWEYLGATLVFLQFFVPFLTLLAPRTKHYAKNLLGIATLIFVVRFIDIYWTVMPGLRSSPWSSLSQWTDYAALAGLGGVWFAVWGAQLSKATLLPTHDRRLEDAPAHA